MMNTETTSIMMVGPKTRLPVRTATVTEKETTLFRIGTASVMSSSVNSEARHEGTTTKRMITNRQLT